MSCGGFLERVGAPPIVRRTTFYTACLPLRGAVGYILLQYGRTDTELVAWTVFAVCLFACIITLGRDADERGAVQECRVWWSRRIHALFLGFLAFSAVMVMYRIFSADVLAIVWMLDVIFGLVSSFSWATF